MDRLESGIEFPIHELAPVMWEVIKDISEPFYEIIMLKFMGVVRLK